MSEASENESNTGFDAKATGRISAYLDGELSEDESLDFEAHLEDDAEVAEHFDQMKRLLGALGNLPDIEAPPDFFEQVRYGPEAVLVAVWSCDDDEPFAARLFYGDGHTESLHGSDTGR